MCSFVYTYARIYMYLIRWRRHFGSTVTRSTFPSSLAVPLQNLDTQEIYYYHQPSPGPSGTSGALLQFRSCSGADDVAAIAPSRIVDPNVNSANVARPLPSTGRIFLRQAGDDLRRLLGITNCTRLLVIVAFTTIIYDQSFVIELELASERDASRVSQKYSNEMDGHCASFVDPFLRRWSNPVRRDANDTVASVLCFETAFWTSNACFLHGAQLTNPRTAARPTEQNACPPSTEVCPSIILSAAISLSVESFQRRTSIFMRRQVRSLVRCYPRTIRVPVFPAAKDRTFWTPSICKA